MGSERLFVINNEKNYNLIIYFIIDIKRYFIFKKTNLDEINDN